MFSTRIEAFSSPKYFLYCQAILKPSSCEITYPEQYKKKNARWQFNLLMKIIQVTYTSSSITTCSSPHHSAPSILLWRRNRSRQCTKEQPWLLQRSCKEQGLLVHNALCHEASKKQKVVWCIRVFHDHYNWAKKESTTQNPCKRGPINGDSVITNAHHKLIIQVLFSFQFAILILMQSSSH